MPPSNRAIPFAALGLLAAATLAALTAPEAVAIKLWERRAAPGEATAARTGRPWTGRGDRPEAPADVAGIPSGPEGLAAPGPEGLAALSVELGSVLGTEPGGGGPQPLEAFVVRRDHLRALRPLESAAVSSEPETAARVAALLEYGNALAQRGYDREAAATYLAAIVVEPELAAAWTNLGTLLRRAEHWDAAERALGTAIALRPREGIAFYHLALVHEARGDLVAADAAYLSALERDPGLWLPRRNPHVLTNERATTVLHRYYLSRAADQAPLAATPARAAPRGDR